MSAYLESYIAGAQSQQDGGSTAQKRPAASTEMQRRLGPHFEMESGMPLCTTCSTQTNARDAYDFDAEDSDYKCTICADPRQYIGYQGQRWTTLKDLHSRGTYHNQFEELIPGSVWTMRCEPAFGIGQRTFFIKDKLHKGLIMWDCSAYVDDATLAYIDEISDGHGITHAAISHPHYYSTSMLWVALFPQMKMWLPTNDFKDWHPRFDVVNAIGMAEEVQTSDAQKIARQINFVTQERTPLEHGSPFTILRLGGHFREAIVLHWRDVLFIADIIQVVPSGRYRSADKQRPGVTSFTFMWSYPNQIPLSANEVKRVCEPLHDFDFSKAFGAFPDFTVWGHAKEKIFQSRDIIIERLNAS